MKKLTDQNMEVIIGKILRYGVYLALAFSITGGLIYLYSNANIAVGDKYKNFAETDESMGKYLSDSVQMLKGSTGIALMRIGILCLLITPTVRLIFSVFGFAAEKDKMYVIITIIVLLVIILSVMGGIG